MTWMSGSGPVTRLTISRSIHGIARRTTLSVFDTGVSHLETPNDGPDAGGGNHGAPGQLPFVRAAMDSPTAGSIRRVGGEAAIRRNRGTESFLPPKRIYASGVSGEQRSSACLPASGLKLTR
jgi:hypothetical protein